MPLNGIAENLLSDLGRQSFERGRRFGADSATVDESLDDSAVLDVGILNLGMIYDAILDATVDGQAIVQSRVVDGRIDHDTICQDDISVSVVLV